MCSVRSNLHHFLGHSYFLVSESKSTQSFFSPARFPVLIWLLLFFLCFLKGTIFRKKTLRFYTYVSVSFPSWVHKDMTLGPFVLFSPIFLWIPAVLKFIIFYQSSHCFSLLEYIRFYFCEAFLETSVSPCLKTKSLPRALALWLMCCLG